MADVLVLAAPMYNFAIPSSLKSWFDHVLRAGLTFRYAEQGPEGLLQGKRAFVLTARGGIYAGGGLDHQEPYLRQVLGFVGIHDVTFIHAEGMNMGPNSVKGLARARERMRQALKPTPPFASLCQRSGDWTQHPVEPLPRVFDRVFIPCGLSMVAGVTAGADSGALGIASFVADCGFPARAPRRADSTMARMIRAPPRNIRGPGVSWNNSQAKAIP